jgi:hypothetical protein
MARYIHKVSGARVDVRDDKVMDSSWEPEGGPTDEGSYSSLKVADLKAEIETRNEGREEDAVLSTEGKKADLIAALEADDAARTSGATE